MIRTFFKFIFRVFFWICALLGLNVVALILIIYFAGLGPFANSSKSLEKDSVLTLTLNGIYVEHTDTSGLESLVLGSNSSLFNLTRAIRHAAQDEKIKGLSIRLEEPFLGPAQIQELREALLVFRQSGKPSWCYTDTFGDSSSGTGLYYLATACEEIWLQPMGSVNLTGIGLEVPFAKGALDKLDVKAEVGQRKEYKSYVEMFTREDFSEPNREELQAIADSILSQFVEGIAKERKLAHEQVRLLINNGPYLTQEAQTIKLVDRIDFRHNLVPVIQEKVGKDIEFIGMKSYIATFSHTLEGDKVALIFGSGSISRDGGDGLWDEMGISSNSTYKAFKEAIEDKDVKAIVYRINSGGGSPSASETIYGIINYAKEHEKKPVIISMSDAAASGGYWIAVAGTKIVAQPATLTGSIGVFGGKFVLSGLFEKLGIKWGSITTSENANMWSMAQSYTPAQWAKLNAELDHIYNGFTARVAKGRHMTLDQVEKVARGRVWTGEQALALGLVDQLGGLHTALDLAKKEANLAPETEVHIYPQSKTFLESLSTLFDEEDNGMIEMGILGTIIRPFQKIWAVFNILLSSQENLYTPLGKMK
ncbi:MAG: signal peptide peptidase SppA [Alphaproteobacteria bacterium]|nr:signal peptide peptidase SppA [Alphaproteobacteria bacterium]